MKKLLPLNLESSILKKKVSRQTPLDPKIFSEGTSVTTFSFTSSKSFSPLSESLESSLNGFRPNIF